MAKKKNSQATTNNNKFTDAQINSEAKKTQKTAEEFAKDKEKTAHLIDEALKKAKKNKGILAKVWDDLMTMIRMVRAWCTGKYKDVPWETIVAALVAIVYFVNPFDLIPDFIPFVGYLDDAAIIALIVSSIHNQLDNFREWEKTVKSVNAI